MQGLRKVKWNEGELTEGCFTELITTADNQGSTPLTYLRNHSLSDSTFNTVEKKVQYGHHVHQIHLCLIHPLYT